MDYNHADTDFNVESSAQTKAPSRRDHSQIKKEIFNEKAFTYLKEMSQSKIIGQESTSSLTSSELLSEPTKSYEPEIGTEKSMKQIKLESCQQIDDRSVKESANSILTHSVEKENTKNKSKGRKKPNKLKILDKTRVSIIPSKQTKKDNSEQEDINCQNLKTLMSDHEVSLKLKDPLSLEEDLSISEPTSINYYKHDKAILTSNTAQAAQHSITSAHLINNELIKKTSIPTKSTVPEQSDNMELNHEDNQLMTNLYQSTVNYPTDIYSSFVPLGNLKANSSFKYDNVLFNGANLVHQSYLNAGKKIVTRSRRSLKRKNYADPETWDLDSNNRKRNMGLPMSEQMEEVSFRPVFGKLDQNKIFFQLN